MIRRPPRSTQSRSSAASDVYKRQPLTCPGEPGPGFPCPFRARRNPAPRWGGGNFRIVARMASRPMLTGLAVGLLLTLVLPAAAATVPTRTGDGVLDVLLVSVDME